MRIDNSIPTINNKDISSKNIDSKDKNKSRSTGTNTGDAYTIKISSPNLSSLVSSINSPEEALSLVGDTGKMIANNPGAAINAQSLINGNRVREIVADIAD